MLHLTARASAVGARCLWSVFALVGVLVLLFPSIGPLADHHFAERGPNHEHIYLGEVVPDHVHSFQVRHTHDHAPATLEADSGEYSTADGGAEGIVYLTTEDGIGPSPGSVAIPSLLEEVFYPDPDDQDSPSGIIHGEGIPAGASIPPPDKPPQF
jgi:hypothetical protein